ncbi:hypothetical protein CDAR_167771 [Caerostris darwini]|uniref:Uncharacterized protein n=1 Tax=Caerostris darwini TaxID=1538125 RepID=A0AAV4MYQ6_9ARAC|nr:hypothetical protein CDAR_167771 [Caerostris darwini]
MGFSALEEEKYFFKPRIKSVEQDNSALRPFFWKRPFQRPDQNNPHCSTPNLFSSLQVAKMHESFIHLLRGVCLFRTEIKLATRRETLSLSQFPGRLPSGEATFTSLVPEKTPSMVGGR